jgi:hypothetical protein
VVTEGTEGTKVFFVSPSTASSRTQRSRTTRLALTKQLGYKGLYSIESGGGGAAGVDPHENVQRIYDVLLANM